MKKGSIRFLIFIACYCTFQYPCISTATNAANGSNSAIIISNQGVMLQRQGKYELAEQKYIQALKLQPNLSLAKQNLAGLYQTQAYQSYSEKYFEKAIWLSKKALVYKPNNVDLYHIIAGSYANLRDAPNAYEYYKKILAINPNDPVAQQNFQVVKYYCTEGTIKNQLNNVKVQSNAPDSLYKLIKSLPSVSNDSIKNMKTILDMIWSEPNGKILLQSLIDNKTPIILTQEDRIPCIKKVYPDVKSSTKCSIEIIIPVKTINGFNDKSSTTYLRVYNLRTFVHEFGHAFISIKKPDNGIGSLEEELGVDMIGYNIALKVITGKYLTKGETQMYSLDSLKNLLTDDHRNLPVYSGFNKAIQSYGIVMLYPEVYSNIPLMYKKLLSEGKVAPVPSFNAYLK